jgi:hypothetical protein
MSYPTFGTHTEAFGSSFRAPETVRHLPVDLLRTSLVTRDPAAVAAAINQFQSQGVAQSFAPMRFFPQAMLFQQNKRNLGGGTARGEMRDPRSSPQSAQAAMHGAQATAQQYMGRPAPVGVELSMRDAAVQRGSQIMSQPAVGPRGVDMARVRPIIQPIDAPPQAYGIAQGRMEQAVAASAATNAAAALQSVAQTRSVYRRIMGF